LHNILSDQRSPSIKYGIGFVENKKVESSSQARASNYKATKTNSKKPDKEVNNQSIQQPKKENL